MYPSKTLIIMVNIFHWHPDQVQVVVHPHHVHLKNWQSLGQFCEDHDVFTELKLLLILAIIVNWGIAHPFLKFPNSIFPLSISLGLIFLCVYFGDTCYWLWPTDRSKASNEKRMCYYLRHTVNNRYDSTWRDLSISDWENTVKTMPFSPKNYRMKNRKI